MILDRKKTPFSERELVVIDEKKSMRGSIPIFNTPISYRENARSLFWDKKPMWAVTANDMGSINCQLYNEHLSRINQPGGNIDDFGVQWVFVEQVGGTISQEGRPRFTDANDWKKGIKIPDVNEWDWAADADAHPADTRFLVNMTPVNGFGFERLISLMDFMNAAMALVDEDQRDSLKEYMDAMADLGIAVVDKVVEYWPCVDGFTLHDDWGSQKDPFFSDEIARDVFLPGMKKLVSHMHELGRYCQLHSCGHTEDRVDVFIEAGIDTWQMQTMNDWDKLYKEVGDKIVIQIPVDEFPFDYSDDEQARAAARYYVDHYCEPGKPSMVVAKVAFTSRAFLEELYRYSRLHYLKQN